MCAESVKTIADIARLAGVSKSTVSRALNDSPLIGMETRERIHAIAQKYNFHANAPARRLSMKESRTIAFVTHPYHQKKGFGLEDMFMLEVLGAISTGLAQNHYDLLLAFVDPRDTEWPARYIHTGRADGFILLTSARKSIHIKALVEMQAPFIVWGTQNPETSYCTVIGDNYKGGKLATEHLMQSGRKHIAFLGGPADEVEVQKRYEAYESTLRTAGFELDANLVSFGNYSIDSGEQRTRSLLESGAPIDGIVAASDFLALGAMRVIQERGLRVPEDIAVIGYDDLSIAEQTTPALTSVSQNIPLAGKLLALNLIQYLQSGAVTNVTIPPSLVIRKSA